MGCSGKKKKKQYNVTTLLQILHKQKAARMGGFLVRGIIIVTAMRSG